MRSLRDGGLTVLLLRSGRTRPAGGARLRRAEGTPPHQPALALAPRAGEPPTGKAKGAKALGEAAPPRTGRRTLLQRPVDPDVGFGVEPQQHLRVEVIVRPEDPGVEEVLPDVADQPLGPCPSSGPGRGGTPGCGSPVDAEAQELRFSTSRPPFPRPSSMMTAFIWSNRSSEGTPRK